ncbi:MAG: hypothetical protein Ct9H300mP16_17940 [Pseudomonadota bacterium]|nr:MAG: hypothetical protein Ct9H300mP16_17940 [Pseudomonadota bacterium]
MPARPRPTKILLHKAPVCWRSTSTTGVTSTCPVNTCGFFSLGRGTGSRARTGSPAAWQGKCWYRSGGAARCLCGRLHFDDGHHTGIYSWETLYELGSNFDTNWQDYLSRLSRQVFPAAWPTAASR